MSSWRLASGIADIIRQEWFKNVTSGLPFLTPVPLKRLEMLAERPRQVRYRELQAIRENRQVGPRESVTSTSRMSSVSASGRKWSLTRLESPRKVLVRQGSVKHLTLKLVPKGKMYWDGMEWPYGRSRVLVAIIWLLMLQGLLAMCLCRLLFASYFFFICMCFSIRLIQHF